MVDDMPDEIWLQIFAHLDAPRDRAQAALVCRDWHRLLADGHDPAARGVRLLRTAAEWLPAEVPGGSPFSKFDCRNYVNLLHRALSEPDLPPGVAFRLIGWLGRHTEHGRDECSWPTLHLCTIVYALARRGWKMEAFAWLDAATWCGATVAFALRRWAAHLAEGRPMDMAAQKSVYVDAGLAETIAVLAAQVDDASLLADVLPQIAAAAANSPPAGDMPTHERLYSEMVCSQVPGRARAHAAVYPPALRIAGWSLYPGFIGELSVDGAEVLLETRVPGNGWRYAFLDWLRIAARCGREATLLPPPEEWRAYTRRDQYGWLLDALGIGIIEHPDLYIRMANLMCGHFELVATRRTHTPAELSPEGRPPLQVELVDRRNLGVWRDFHHELWSHLCAAAQAVLQGIHEPNGAKTDAWLLSSRVSKWLATADPDGYAAKLVREARRWLREGLTGGRG